MGPIAAFMIKFLAILAAVLFVGLFQPLTVTMNWVHALIIAVIISVVGYFTDWFMLRAVNSIAAVFVDFVVAMLVVMLGNILFPGVSISWTYGILVGVTVAVVEVVYHSAVISPQLRNKM